MTPWTLARLHETLPPERHVDAADLAWTDPRERLVVLDDDPTGNQAVHGLEVLATWQVDVLTDVLERERTAFVLTNSRALPEDVAAATYSEIAGNLLQAAGRAGVRLRVASRSDSTLRGHFPAEVDALHGALGTAACLLVPCFVEGGRLTFDDTQWVRQGEDLVPAHETPYSRDATFGYRSGHLPSWVAERSGGAIAAGDVRSISIEDLRLGGPARVAERLRGVRDGVVVANAVTYPDLEVLVAGLRQAEGEGATLLYRCGASFVRVRAGVAARDLLTPDELLGERSGAGGLVVCGSHVPTSTAQLDRLLQLRGAEGIELRVRALLDETEPPATLITSVARAAADVIRGGRHAVVFTSRDVAARPDLDPLDVGRRVSDALVEVVRRVDVEPAFLVAKGGITSHDIATRALRMTRGRVLGQIAPGIPVWRLLDGDAAGAPYVVFPGNVGEAGTLADIVQRLADDAG